MPLQINSSGWQVRRPGTSRGAAVEAAVALPTVPEWCLTDESRVAEEVVLETAPATRGAPAAAPSALDVSYDVGPGETAVLAVRQPSGALTFHLPIQSTSRGRRGPSQVRFQVPVRQATTRGVVAKVVKAIVIKVAKVAADQAVSLVVPRLAAAVEKQAWKSSGLKEGWLKVTKDTLAAGALAPGKPVSPPRRLLFIHGTFSNAASAFRDLAASTFFERVKDAYDDRIFAFDHFSISRTPEDNARMLLEGLPDHATTFDVVTHSRGGLVLRNLVERSSQLGDLSRRFKLGRAVLVASPNDGTPLATPTRWDDTIGWFANVIEMFPDNPFTTGAAFVANGLVWLANHVLGDLPGLHSMDGEGELIGAIQGPPAPPPNAYSALVANYQPPADVLRRLVDIGIDQFFGSANDLVVPSEGGWRVDAGSGTFIPGTRIGCFGPGGNLPPADVTHVNFFARPETVDFLVNALLGKAQPLNLVDPRKALPDRRLLRGISDVPAAAGTAARPAARAAATRARTTSAAREPLRITVMNGDLTFEREALLLGHYAATRLTGTERVMDTLIGGAMQRSLEMGVYPLAVGSHQIFVNTRPNQERGTFLPRPKAVIVVGLGQEGNLQSGDIVHSVRQAVIAWAQRLSEAHARVPRTFDLAATLLGSGGPGVTPGEAARLIAQGVHEANELLAGEEDKDATWPRVAHLRFVELYLDRATEAWRSLRLQDEATPGRYAVDNAVQRGTGPLQRPTDSGYRGADFDFITVETRPQPDGTPEIAYTLDTRRARSEVRAARAQSRLIAELVAAASNEQNTDQQIGRTLFDLLIPIELEAYLVGCGEMQIELDPQTAKIPWELLDTQVQSEGDLPWAIRVNLLRKLRVQKFRERITDADPTAAALVIGEPACPADYARLYGARGEALAVRACLIGPGGLPEDSVSGLISDDPVQQGPDARAVINALFEKPWRLVHIAGHGVLPENGKPGGVVLSNGTFLGPDEIERMRTVPELVFVNCCHIGSADAQQLLKSSYDRATFASGVAGALIGIGVKCVVAAGWAVDDEAARIFAEEFYGSLLRGNRFIVAVGEARTAAYRHSPNLNTWAAYQCYGDPDWVFRKGQTDPNVAGPGSEEFSGIASAASLKLALERLVVETRFQGKAPAAQLEKLRKLEGAYGPMWGASGDVAELFAEAFVEAGDVETGLNWYERAVAAPDGKNSMRAAEQLANVRGRLAWEIVSGAAARVAAATTAEQASRKAGKGRQAARRVRADAQRALRQAVTRADQLIEDALSLLQTLIAVEPTQERAGLLGSAYKRQALVDGAANRRARRLQALRLMAASYAEAQAIGEKAGSRDVYYPAANRLVAEAALGVGARRAGELDGKTVALVRRSLEADMSRDPGFWNVVGLTELDQYTALAKRKLAAARPKLEKAYADVRRRVPSARLWASVYDTACMVLPDYAERAGAREQAAARALLGQLREYAHPKQDA